jgi:hypothetical protein
MGPFQTMGSIFKTIGETARAAEVTVTRTTNIIEQSFDMADYAMNDVKEELETDRIIENAKRKVKRAEAEAEAAKIIAALPTTP